METIDKSNMRKIILDFPKQFRAGLESAKNVKVRGGFDEVLICGMGGSALPADILQIWLEAYKIGLPLYIHRNYGLPYLADESYLVVCISYSGNTEETLTAFHEAKSKGLKMVCITSGGKLLQLCKKPTVPTQYEIPAAVIPGGYQPRMAAGFQFSALMKILANCGIIKNSLENISALEKTLKPETLEVRGRKLAKKLKGRIPIIYSSERLKNLARIWKIKFNENAKIPAFHNHFPELNHHEMVGYENCRHPMSVIMLRDPADHPKIQKRMKLTAEILKKRGAEVDIIEIKGQDILYKVFSSILLADWVSYYLALEYKIDPMPVKIVEELKKKL